MRDAFDCGDFLARDSTNSHLTRAYRRAVEKDCASSALSLAATVFRAGQVEIVAKHKQEQPILVGVNGQTMPVDSNFHVLILDLKATNG